MWKKLKKKNKKGFTLVELIVVLVILAILAALLIPALTGYIDKSKERQIIAETRQIVMASQTLVDEKYAKMSANATISLGATASTSDTAIVIAIPGTANDTVAGLSEVQGATATTVTNVTITGGKVTTLTYTARGKKCVYTANPADANADKYVVTDATS